MSISPSRIGIDRQKHIKAKLDCIANQGEVRKLIFATNAGWGLTRKNGIWKLIDGALIYPLALFAEGRSSRRFRWEQDAAAYILGMSDDEISSFSHGLCASYTIGRNEAMYGWGADYRRQLGL